MNGKDIIEALEGEVKIPEIVQKKADQAFAKILEHPLKTDRKSEAKPASKISKKRIGIFAAAAVLAAATVSVTAALNWSKSLSEGLQATPVQMKKMEETNMNTFVNQKCTDQGITITAVQSITDSHYTHLAFKVEGYTVAPGEQPGFERISVTVDGKDDFSSGSNFYNGIIIGPDGSSVHVDGTPIETDENGSLIENYVMADGSLEYHITLANSRKEGSFINKPVHVEFNNLGVLGKADYFHRVSGKWSFDWDLQGSPDVKKCELNVPLDDINATLLKAEISPISLRLEYQFPKQAVSDPDLDEDHDSFLDPPMMLLSGVKMKDGTLFPFLYLGPGTSGYQSPDSDIAVNAFVIDRILDVDQVDSLLLRKSDPKEGQPYTEEHFYVVPIE